MGPIRAHHMAAPGQEHLDAAIPVARVLGGELAHRRQRRGVALDQPRPVAPAGPGHLEQRARSPDRQAALTHIRDLLPPDGCAHHFFAATSFITSISRSRSATSFLSLVFSCSR